MQIEVKVKSIGSLQSGDKKDGSGKWYARDIVLVCNDGSMYPDEFPVHVTGDTAQNGSIREGQAYLADISFSKREYKDRMYPELYLRNLGESQKDKPF